MIITVAASGSPRPVKGSGALDCSLKLVRARVDLRKKLKWAAPGECKTRIEQALKMLDEAAALLLDEDGPRVWRAEFLVACAVGMA
jgi:hypothetical protein